MDLQDLTTNAIEVNLPDTLVDSDWSSVPSLMPSISPLTIISELFPTSRVRRLGWRATALLKLSTVDAAFCDEEKGLHVQYVSYYRQ